MEINTDWINIVKEGGDAVIVNGVDRVPKNTANNEYQAVLKWEAEGGVREPEFTQSELDQQVKDKRIAEIDTRLDQIDMESVRSLRSKTNGRGVQADNDILLALDNEAINLREERAALT